MSRSKKKLNNMLCLDIYLSSLSEKEQKKLQPLIEPNPSVHPLLSADIYLSMLEEHSLMLKKDREKKTMHDFANKFNWSTDIDFILTHEYFALVLTDINQTIQWVNSSFAKMTGYPAKYAIGKSPRFLQGENTSEETRKRIRQHIAAARPFTETLLNYRKNKEEYPCTVSVFPLFDQTQKVTHFLALEMETARSEREQ